MYINIFTAFSTFSDVYKTRQFWKSSPMCYHKLQYIDVTTCLAVKLLKKRKVLLPGAAGDRHVDSIFGKW